MPKFTWNRLKSTKTNDKKAIHRLRRKLEKRKMEQKEQEEVVARQDYHLNALSNQFERSTADFNSYIDRQAIRILDLQDDIGVLERRVAIQEGDRIVLESHKEDIWQKKKQVELQLEQLQSGFHARDAMIIHQQEVIHAEKVAEIEKKHEELMEGMQMKVEEENETSDRFAHAIVALSNELSGKEGGVYRILMAENGDLSKKLKESKAQETRMEEQINILTMANEVAHRIHARQQHEMAKMSIKLKFHNSQECSHICELVKNFECNICFETLDENNWDRVPRNLDCGHTFCTLCIRKLLNETIPLPYMPLYWGDQTKKKELTCPNCQRVMKVNSVEQLPKAYILFSRT